MTKRAYTRVKDHYDPRDRHYTRHTKMGDANYPRQIDLRPFCSEIENQGNTSSCTGHAVIGAVEIDENYQRAIQAAPFKRYSRLFVYYNERLIEGDVGEDGGGQIRDAVRALVDYGVCEETTWPFDENAVLTKPSMEAYAEAVACKATNYEMVPQTEDALLHCLAVTKRPIVFGIYIFPSFESDQVAMTGQVPMPGFGERCIGGHAVLIVGYDLDKRVFIVRNSWGPDWGDRGYFYLPFDYVLSPKLSEDFWCIEKVSAL